MILRSYIMRSLVRPFFIGFGFITFLLMMEMLLDLLELLLSKGIDLATVTKLLLLALGWMVALSVPCGVLVAVLMTYGTMSQDNEITALRASGVHIYQIVAPTLYLSVILAAALAGFNNYILPETNHAYAKLMQQISRKNPTAKIRSGTFLNDFDGYSIWISRLDDRSGAMEDVLIFDSSGNPQAPRTILAKEGTLEFVPEEGRLTLILRDGTIQEAEHRSKEGKYREIAFDTQTLNIAGAGDMWAEAPEKRRSDRELSIGDMKKEIDRLESQRVNQETQVLIALDEIGLQSLGELSQLEPDIVPPSRFDDLRKRLPAGLRPVPPEPREWTINEEKNLSLIRSRLREALGIEKRINKFKVEIHKKFSIPTACVVFVLVGAPLGMLARRGGMAVALFSAVFFIFYYLFLIGGEQLADRNLTPTWLAMWLPNLILGGLGFLLLRRALRSGRTAPRMKRASS